MINKLKNKIELLNNEIKKKDEIIENLKNSIDENLKISIDENLKNSIDENNMSPKKTNGLLDAIKIYNDNNDKKNTKFNNNKDGILTKIEEVKNNENDDNSVDLLMEDNKPKRLNSEIEQLDQEIFNLKSKLKKIIE